MKIIHTSDWHLGNRLYNWDGTDEEEHFFTQLSAAVAEEQPDALVVSGDIFDTGVPGNDVAKRFTDALLEVTSRCPGMATFGGTSPAGKRRASASLRRRPLCDVGTTTMRCASESAPAASFRARSASQSATASTAFRRASNATTLFCMQMTPLASFSHSFPLAGLYSVYPRGRFA